MLIFSRYKLLRPWLVEGKYFWFALAVNLLPLAICLQPGTSEPFIRLTGLLLQLFGIGTVIWGISETRAFFGHPPIIEKTKNWLRRFPLLQRSAVVGSASITLSASIVNGRAFGTVGPGPNPTIESRLDAAEKNITAIHERITATQREMDEEHQKVSSALKQEHETREENNATLAHKLEATSTGGVHISAIGASWLFVGVVLSTAATELSAFLK